MKITIDTNEDSKDHIKKLIRMLSALVDEPVKYSTSQNIFEDDAPQPTNEEGGVFGNLFGDSSEQSTDAPDTAEAKQESNDQDDPVELQFY